MREAPSDSSRRIINEIWSRLRILNRPDALELESVESKFRLLHDEQNRSFDFEHHSPQELLAKLLLLEEATKGKPFHMLDLGGGNGTFADKILDRFPESRMTILDISYHLLTHNKPSPRKELIHGSIEDVHRTFAGRAFDYISMNWVLHHLVGNGYRASRQNCVETLKHCQTLLKPNGMLIVAENMVNGYLQGNLPSHLIYAITATTSPCFVHLAKRFFNTAGVGVCFQSQRAWEHIFSLAGFEVVAFQQGLMWWWLKRSLRGMAIHLLSVKSISHGHFFLRPA